MKRSMRQLDPGHGDKLLHVYDVDVTSPEELEKIEKEFDQKRKEGWFAANITDHTSEEIIHKFDPSADILMIPRIQGGVDGRA